MHTFYLVRHGESQANAGLPSIGPENIALTPRGIEQAKLIARYFKSSPLRLIATSSYVRTQQTAAYTRELYPFIPLQQWRVQEFTYLSSIHQVCSTTEDRRPLVDAYWQRLLPDFEDDPGSESFRSFIGRAQALIAQLINPAYDTVAVFSHRQFISAVLWLIECEQIEISAQTMQKFKCFLEGMLIPNGAIVQVKVRQSRAQWDYELITEHLKRPI